MRRGHAGGYALHITTSWDATNLPDIVSRKNPVFLGHGRNFICFCFCLKTPQGPDANPSFQWPEDRC